MPPRKATDSLDHPAQLRPPLTAVAGDPLDPQPEQSSSVTPESTPETTDGQQAASTPSPDSSGLPQAAKPLYQHQTRQPPTKPIRGPGRAPATQLNVPVGLRDNVLALQVALQDLTVNRDEPADDAVDEWFTMEIGGGVRRTRITARGKRDQVLSWRVAHADSARRTFKSMREPYRRMMREADPTGAYALTMSNLTATALARALHNPATWIGTVENDGRMNPKAVTPGKRGRTSTFGVLWPVRLIELLQEKYETFDASLVWPEGFRLTKANFMAAAILYELETVEQWLVEIPNDDRQVVLGNVEQSIGLA